MEPWWENVASMSKSEKQRDAKDPARPERETVQGLKKALSEGWRQLRARIPLTLRALGLSVFILALLLVALYSGLAHAANGWRDASAVLINLATITILLIGGAWAFFVFVIGRGFSASINIEVETEQMTSLAERQEERCREVLITIRATNTGKTSVDLRPDLSHYLMFERIRKDELPTLPKLSLMSSSFEKIGRVEFFEVFEEILGLEPGQEAAESILITVAEEFAALKIALAIKGYVGPTLPLPKKWRSERMTGWRRDMVRALDKLRGRDSWTTRRLIVFQKPSG